MSTNLRAGILSEKKVLAAIIAAFVFFVFLWMLDFPKPMTDDLFYAGAGINMAGGGDFSNPFVAHYFPNEHFFFAYPPVYSYAIAGWLKIFGINSAAATGFQAIMYLVLTAAVIAVLKRNEAPVGLMWLVPLIVAGSFLNEGLRTETMAAALAWTGFAMMESGARKIMAVFFAFLLMFLAGATAPRVTAFDLALMAVAAVRLWQSPVSGAVSKLRQVIAVLAALAVVVLVVLLMIHFRVTEFWTTFHQHSQILKGKKAPLSILHKAFITVCVIMSIFALRFRKDHLVQICVALGMALCAAIFTATIGYGMGGWHAMVLVLFFGAALAKRVPRIGKIAVQSALTIFLVLRNFTLILQIVGILSGGIKSDRGDEYTAARSLTSTPAEPLCVDPMVARYTFDYRTPPGSIDFIFAAPFPYAGKVMPSLVQTARPQDTFLLGSRSRDYVERSTYLPARPRPQWTLLGQSFDEYPCRVFIIRADEWKGLKSATEKSVLSTGVEKARR